MSLKIDQNLEFTTVDGDPISVPVGKVSLFAKDGTKKLFIKDDTGLETDISSGGDLLASNNLSDVISAATALTNLGAEPSFTKNTAFNKNFGSAAGTVAEGSDARLSDARVPLAHSIAGVEHTADTLANLNAKISDATLVDTANLILQTEKAANNGVATLDGTGLVPSSQIPTLTLGAVFSVADIPARDALTPVQGDIAIVADNGTGTAETYIWDGTAWQTLVTSGAVLSVAGKVGVVNLIASDISATTVSGTTVQDHISGTGADHTWLDQSLLTTDSVNFGSLSTTGDLNAGSGTFFVNSSTGNVGINDTASNDTLSIRDAVPSNGTEVWSKNSLIHARIGVASQGGYSGANQNSIYMMVHEAVNSGTAFGLNRGGLGLISTTSNANTMTALAIGTSIGIPMVFGTNNIERMRLSGSGAISSTESSRGFFGVPAVAQQATAPTATDLATVLTLANTLKTALTNLGLTN